MKSLFLFTLLSIVASMYQCGYSPVPPPSIDTSATLTSFSPCDKNLWARTFGAMSRFGDPPAGTNPYLRTTLRHRCVVDVKGTVVSVDRYEQGQLDGDIKIKLRLNDSNYAPRGFYTKSELLNAYNHDLLTVELVCAAKPRKRLAGWKLPGEMSPVTDPDNDSAVKACRDYTNLVTFPQRGDEILVTGELVTDTGPMKNPRWTKDNGLPQFIPGHGGKEIHPVTRIKIIYPPGNSQPPVRE